MSPSSRTDGSERVPRLRTRLARRAKFSAYTLTAFYLAVLVILKLLESSMVYPGQYLPHEAVDLPGEEVHFQSADGQDVYGCYLEHEVPIAHVLFCYGNGDNVSRTAEYLAKMRDEHQVSILTFDYRGYGGSEGRPDEAGILANAEAAQAWLAARAGVQPDQLVLIGRSLGGGVAVHLAATRGARGLVLERTFTSLVDVAAQRLWWAPVRLLMRNRYDSLARIAGYRGPLLQSHGTADEIVPFESGMRLFQEAPCQPKQFVPLKMVGHNGPNGEEYNRALRGFLGSLPAALPAATETR